MKFQIPNFKTTVAVLLGMVLLGGCASPLAKPKVVEPYMQVERKASGDIQLQVAMRKFVPQRGSGPAIWLVAASHVGDTNYYNAIQNELDSKTLVLFEGIRDRNGHDRPAPRAEREQQARESSPLQSNMAAALGLIFQLEAIDYDRTNFQNSDLSITQLTKLMTAKPASASGADKQFSGLLEAMSGNSFLSGVINLVFKAIGSDPKFRAMARLGLLETFDGIKGDLLKMEGLPPDMKELIRVIIEERDKQVVKDLKTATKKFSKKDSIAVFYGVGHMFDLEKRLDEDLSYRPEKTVWLNAFSVNPAASGLAPAEVEMIRSLVNWQTKMMSQ